MVAQSVVLVLCAATGMKERVGVRGLEVGLGARKGTADGRSELRPARPGPRRNVMMANSRSYRIRPGAANWPREARMTSSSLCRETQGRYQTGMHISTPAYFNLQSFRSRNMPVALLWPLIKFMLGRHFKFWVPVRASLVSLVPAVAASQLNSPLVTSWKSGGSHGKRTTAQASRTSRLGCKSAASNSCNQHGALMVNNSRIILILFLSSPTYNSP